MSSPSPLFDPTIAGISLVVGVAGLVAVSKWKGSQSLPYPPGPPPDPIIGNARAMTSDDLERVFAAWGKKYGALFLSDIQPDACMGLLNFVIPGDVNYVTVVGKPIIVLNSYQAAKDLLEKRSGMYSSRPRMVMLCELCVHLIHKIIEEMAFRNSDSIFLTNLQDGVGRGSIASAGWAQVQKTPSYHTGPVQRQASIKAHPSSAKGGICDPRRSREYTR